MSNKDSENKNNDLEEAHNKMIQNGTDPRTKVSFPGSEQMLSIKEESFCREFCDSNSKGYLNTVKAYQLSLYSTDNSKIESIRANAYKLIKKPHIKARICELGWGGDIAMGKLFADIGLKYLLTQRKDLTNLRAAIDIVYKLDGAYKGGYDKPLQVNIISYKDAGTDT